MESLLIRIIGRQPDGGKEIVVHAGVNGVIKGTVAIQQNTDIIAMSIKQTKQMIDALTDALSELGEADDVVM